jgi:SAM-dependent methyltransferase
VDLTDAEAKGGRMADYLAMFEDQAPIAEVDEASLKAIPAKRGVALLLARDDQPILLLPAADMRSRIRNRLRNPSQEELSRMADLAAITTRICWLRTFSHFETDWAYLELARAIWPRTYRELLSIKPPWFVHVDADEETPHFRRGRNVLDKPGIKIGPFPTAKAAEAYIEIIEEVFDLCRQPHCLAEAPNAAPCTYGQMNRCLRPCDGTISMEDYRQVVREAAEFAAGRREPTRERIEGEMKQAAGKLDYERAARCKSRLERMAQLDRPDFALARRLESHLWLVCQPGPTFHQAKAWAVAPGAIAAAPLLDYPLVADQLEAAREATRQVAGGAGALDEADRYRLALLCRLMFSGPQRRGLLIDASEGLDPDDLARRIDQSRELLGLRAPRKRSKGSGPSREQPAESTDK